MKIGPVLFVTLCLLTLSSTALAQQVPLDGFFIALSPCEANKKKDRDNPGDVRLEFHRAYEMLARNATPGTHFQIKVPGAPATEARWVPMNCGAFAPQEALVIAGTTPRDDGEPNNTGGLAPDSIELVLAASWHPAFCATPVGFEKVECRSQTADRFDATHFSLHGLWSDDLDDTQIFPCYCDRGAPTSCTRSQHRDTSIELSSGVMQQLEVAMPGMHSGLHLHEWPKHGSCYEDDKSGADAGADPDEYFTESMAVLRALNHSAVRRLFAAHLGESLTRDQIEAAFDEDFGEGAGDRVLIRCASVGGEKIITELWIGMQGDITDPADLRSLIQAAPRTARSTDRSSCSGGHIVRVAG